MKSHSKALKLCRRVLSLDPMRQSCAPSVYFVASKSQQWTLPGGHGRVERPNETARLIRQGVSVEKGNETQTPYFIWCSTGNNRSLQPSIQPAYEVSKWATQEGDGLQSHFAPLAEVPRNS